MKRHRSGPENQIQKPTKETETEVSGFCISALPTSLLLEIFLRLPIADIMKCKLVCTEWYKLISESSFTDYYAKNSTITHLLLPMSRSITDSSTQLLYLHEITKTGDCVQSPIKVKLPGRMENKSLKFRFDLCNGLLMLTPCLRKPEVIFISNPLTGDCIRLPEHDDCDDKSVVFYKFGFSPSIDKFKVLRFVYKIWYDSKIDSCAILTVGIDDRWRHLSNPFRRWCFWANWICLNGAFHWILDDSGSFRIATLDIAVEKFGQISPPPGLVLDSKNMDLALFNNQLTLVDVSVPSQITLWTMKDYAFAKSWTKDVILRSWFPSAEHINFLFLVEKLRNGNILFGDDTHLISFNDERKECSKIEVFRSRRITSCIMTYTPSFRSFREMQGHWSTMHV